MRCGRFCFTFLALVMLVGCKSHRTKSVAALEFSVWYWNSPYEPSSDDLEDLGIGQVFVRAATVVYEDGYLIVPRVQSFRWFDVSNGRDPQVGDRPGDVVSPLLPPRRPPITLVINLEGSVVSNIGRISAEELASKLAEVFESTRSMALRVGERVLGLQIDFDCPTSKLGYYRDVLRLLRARVSPWQLSITALPTWLDSDAFPEVARLTEFYVPQFYEGRLGTTLGDPAPISDLAGLAHGIERAEAIGLPYWVGVAAYGHAALYDARGRLTGTYKLLSPSEALRHPSLKLEDAYPADAHMGKATGGSWIGEDVLRFRAVTPDQRGKGLGSTILFKIPTSKLLERQLEVVRRTSTEHLRGVIVFRWPEPGEQLALPIKSVASVVRGQHPRPVLELQARVQTQPWDLVERPKGEHLPSSIRIVVENTGDEGTQIGPDAIQLTVRFNRPGFRVSERVQPAPLLFDAVGLNASRLRAQVAVFSGVYLAPGEKRIFGPIHVDPDGPTQVSAELAYRRPGGFETFSAELAPTPIANLKR